MFPGKFDRGFVGILVLSYFWTTKDSDGVPSTILLDRIVITLYAEFTLLWRESRLIQG